MAPPPQEARPERRRTKRGPSLAPLYGGMLVAILAIVVVALAKKNDKAREGAEQPVVEDDPAPRGNPFSRTARSKNGEDATASYETAPSDLLQSQVWIDALGTAEEGLIALRAAREKRDAGDQGGYIDGAVHARDLFNQALDDTVEWEMGLVEKHGEQDPLVRKVQEERAKWFQHRKSLRQVHMLPR